MKDTSLTKKQTEILLLLYTFRFLHTYQIQKLLNHKNPNRVKVWLKNLTEKEYLKRDYTKETMNKKPAIYYLAIKSREILKKRKDCDITVLNKIYREKNRSQTFISHCLIIADIYLSLREKLKENETLHYSTKTDLIAYDYFPSPLPDAYIALKRKNVTKRYFLEVFDDNLPRFAIRGKIQRFVEYYQGNQWEENTDSPFPQVLLACPNDTIKKYTRRFITKTLAEAQAEISFSFWESYGIVSLG